jgi:Arc/MetJ-type ribon-helix-helix transcriptional regulator
MYGTMYGVKRTTVYLPDELKAALERTAADTGRSEAELIREGVRQVTRDWESPEPRVLFSSGIRDLAEDVDRHLEGFGER